ncbi:MAG: YtxH domain-containing protein [Spirosomataceae bacterium]
MTSNSKVVLGIVTAAAAGAVIGMLFAPEKGTDLREKVRDTANDLASDLLDAIQKGRQQFVKTEEELEENAQALKTKAIGKIAEAKERIDDEVDEIKDKAKKYA